MKKYVTKDAKNRTTETLNFEPSEFVSVYTSPQKSPILTNDNGVIDETLLPVKPAREVSSFIEYGEEISAMRAIYLGEDGRAYKARYNGTYDQANVYGFTLQHGLAGEVGEYMIFGKIVDQAFTMESNQDLFLWNDGSFADDAPDHGHLVSLGRSLELGSIFFDPLKPIVL